MLERRVLSPAFRSSAVKSFEENMRRYVHLLVERLGLLDKNKACEEKSDAVGGHHEAIVDRGHSGHSPLVRLCHL